MIIITIVGLFINTVCAICAVISLNNFIKENKKKENNLNDMQIEVNQDFVCSYNTIVYLIITEHKHESNPHSQFLLIL